MDQLTRPGGFSPPKSEFEGNFSKYLFYLAKLSYRNYKRGVDDPYLDIAKLIERLHRRFLDVVRAELNRLGYRDLTPVQAMLLTNIGDEEIVIRELIERGYYQGSNVSYNMKKLVEGGYIEQSRSPHDKRSVRIKLTEKSRGICEKIHELELANGNALRDAGVKEDDVDALRETLRNIERVWSDFIQYGRG